MSMKPPPPMPHEKGSVTPSIAAAATAASMAFPPPLSVSIAAQVPRWSTVAAAPPFPTAVGTKVVGGTGSGSGGAASIPPSSGGSVPASVPESVAASTPASLGGSFGGLTGVGSEEQPKSATASSSEVLLIRIRPYHHETFAQRGEKRSPTPSRSLLAGSWASAPAHSRRDILRVGRTSPLRYRSRRAPRPAPAGRRPAG